jgi:D-alanyl-lipoteichoic acid acyltransferase DltB (MBOAT superfamily)
MRPKVLIQQQALSAAVIAGSVAVFLSPGPYGFFSLIISFILFIVVLGYSASNARTKRQSLAIAAVLAFSLLPAIGFFLELIIGGNLDGVVIISENGLPPYLDSHVTDEYLFYVWAPLSIVFYIFDQILLKEGIGDVM